MRGSIRSIALETKVSGVVLGLMVLLFSQNVFAETFHVIVQDMKFTPDTLEIKTGDTVIWENKDILPHTATSKAFDSKMIKPDGQYPWKAKKAGEISYRCLYHPTMVGKIKVKAGSS